jgi:BirA family transcriptional regulator, biotin operon repressor / biotin---[acetyl-CoA-carboxylase] ligase
LSLAADVAQAHYDGERADDLARRLGLPAVAVFDEVGSTLDVAHALAADGALSGTLVIADAQSAGRGRMGRSWRSEAGAGVWLTLIERPASNRALDVLSLRIGLALAPALDALAEDRVRLKWPNDLYVRDQKLAGVLVEARWRESVPEWVAIGVGINVRVPRGAPNAVGLRDGVSRIAVLDVSVPAIRAAAALEGQLDDSELRDFADRDLAKGRRCVEPVAGTVRGIDASGALLVGIGSEVTAVRGGSLVLQEER